VPRALVCVAALVALVWFVIALAVWGLLAAGADLPAGAIGSGAVFLAWLHLRDAYNLS
jgi:hypothetical protein